MYRRRASKSLVLAASVIAATLVLSGCSALSTLANLVAGASRGNDGQIAGGGDLDVFDLAVGDCFADVPMESETFSIRAVPCDQEHVYEVFHTFQLPEGDFPTGPELDEATFAACDPVFADFVGVPYEESELEYFWFVPTEEGWESMNDRTVTCSIGTEGVTVIGTAAGSQR